MVEDEVEDHVPTIARANAEAQRASRLFSFRGDTKGSGLRRRVAAHRQMAERAVYDIGDEGRRLLREGRTKEVADALAREISARSRA